MKKMIVEKYNKKSASYHKILRKSHLTVFSIVAILLSLFVQSCAKQKASDPKRWRIVRSAKPVHHFNELFFSDAKHGWAVTREGKILHTSDGGSNWVYQESGVERDLTSVQFIDPRRGWIVGEEGLVFHTEDGGKNWMRQSIDTKHQLRDVHFVDENDGCCVGGNEGMGIVFHTSDGGKNWTRQNLPKTDRELHGVHFVDANYGWIVGVFGVLMKTTDGGKNWEYNRDDRTTPTSNSLFDVYFVDEREGWIVGVFGTLMHTKDGGNSWKQQGSLTTHHLCSIQFLDSKIGWPQVGKAVCCGLRMAAKRGCLSQVIRTAI